MLFLQANYIRSLSKKDIRNYYLTIVVSMIVLGLLSGLTAKLFGGDLSSVQLYTKSGLSKKQFIFFAVIYAPIVEELAFRYFLNYKVESSRISFSLMFGYCCITLFSFFSMGIYKYFFVLLFSGLFYMFYSKKIDEEFVEKWKGIYIYLSVFFFGFSHIMNFDFDLITVAHIPYIFIYGLVLSIYGYTFTVIRIRKGMKYSMLVHALKNYYSSVSLLLFL
ncbi:CPBP family glutamic-type intramembrane protease [Flammeovirga sp. OC4]|uniref:CPBP family glutamic-type intramembrane protease n=1 Tax=Flammeovirga sp. OC4 TaxID=1382345 RepID=UPI0005C62D8C|nr:CPBP family glutamic-type intramembrane protease [Flammeovirga sp. OC4]